MRTVLFAVVCAAVVSISPPSQAQAGKNYTGIMKSMMVDKTGEILQISIMETGTNSATKALGCGAKLQAQPLLLWAFENQKIVYLNVDASNCFSSFTVKS